MNEQRAIVSTPIGRLLLAGDSECLYQVLFESQIADDHPELIDPPKSGPVARAAEQLDAYFRGELEEFDLPLSPRGTEFQCKVWNELQRIPYGATVNYGELAKRINSPKAVRAVGAANGRNPIPVVIPCHRVIGSDGSLTGFGGGLKIKQLLLELEGSLSASSA